MRRPHALALTLALTASCGIFQAVGYGPRETGEDERAARVFEEYFLETLDRRPQMATRLGLEQGKSLWNPRSEDFRRAENERNGRLLERIRREFDPDSLSPDTSLSLRLLERELEQQIADFRWRLHEYPVNQMHGLQAEVPAFLINSHTIATVADAEAYVARLSGIQPLFEDLRDQLARSAKSGVLPPRFVFPRVLSDCRNILSGAPFQSGAEDGVLLADFRTKVAALGLSAPEAETLLARAQAALLQAVRPAYLALIADLQELEALATEEAGVWRLPEGEEFYAARLARFTTTDLDADRIHSLGLSEVARIHAEMNVIREEVGYEGDLMSLFDHLRADPAQYYEESEAGAAAYLARATEIIADMEARLDELFSTRPAAPMVVKRVEDYRERSAGKAFYSIGSPDGTRPGVYYANLYRMADMPKYQMEALAYHEGIPGHHMQLSIAQEREGLPRFRRHLSFTAYVEGWALYTELVPKELGFYADPYSDFGRLAMELWRACRLVVDTGIHRLRWTREEAIAYLRENTPNPEGDCVKAIERYIVMPGQATAYKVGMNAILDLRAGARAELGSRFDLRAFHDVVLRSGALPLDLLAEEVRTWVTTMGAEG